MRMIKYRGIKAAEWYQNPSRIEHNFCTAGGRNRYTSASGEHMGKRIVYIAASVLLAHVIASYICVWVAGMRVEELNHRFGAAKYMIPTNLKVQAPVRVFQLLGMLKKIDSGKGTMALWGAYFGPLVLIGAALTTAPRWLFVDEDESRSMYAGKKRR